MASATLLPMFSTFEKLLNPYPEAPPGTPPSGLVPFVWACTAGARGLVLGMIVLTASIGAFEAYLFNMLGDIVDWLGRVEPSVLWTQERTHLLLLAAILLASPLIVGLQTLIKHQALAANLPMRLRWNFHRLMLGQSMQFYQDEFAGRVATKVMQTALATRDVVMILCDIMVFVVIYFVTIIALVGRFDAWLLLPFLGWLALYCLAIAYFVPRLGRVAKAQADARSLMTGRITDAYTNIATVKLFSHAGRESGYVRSAMQEFIVTVHRQMRLVSGREPSAQHAADRLYRRCHALAVDPGSTRRRCGSCSDCDGPAAERHFALGDVGDGFSVRTHRHGAGWHEHAVASSPGDGPCRGGAAEGHAW